MSGNVPAPWQQVRTFRGDKRRFPRWSVEGGGQLLRRCPICWQALEGPEAPVIRSRMMETRDTVTLPNLPQEGNKDDYVTALRIVGLGIEYPLSPSQTIFTLGASPSCDIVIDNGHVSAVHCLLTRRGGRIRVVDQQSHNGTYFRTRRDPKFDIGPGDAFAVAGTQLLAMTADMSEAREVLAEIASTDQNEPERFVDDILAASMRGPHVMIIGEPGCDQERLALALHHLSRWKTKLIEINDVPADRKWQRKLLDEACNGAICVTLKGRGVPMDETFLSMLLSTDFRIRLFVLAPMMSVANNALGFHVVSRMLQIPLLPIRERIGHVPALLDRIMEARRSPLRFADLRSENQNALLRHGWPENFIELRDAATRLIALDARGSVKSAAASLRMARTTLQYWVNGMKLELPLTSHSEAVSVARHL
jgi:FHA domain